MTTVRESRDLQERIALACRAAESDARVRYELEVENPRRARAEARAWVGIIELPIMGPHEDGYRRGSRHSYHRARSFDDVDAPYSPPKVAIVPAAEDPEIAQSGCHMRVIYLPKGSTMRVLQVDLPKIVKIFGQDVKLRPKLIREDRHDERYTEYEITLPDDRVHVSWRMQNPPMTHDPKYDPPFTKFLMTTDGVIHRTSRVTLRITAAFPSEEMATAWANGLRDSLVADHNRNHQRMCDDPQRCQLCTSLARKS